MKILKLDIKNHPILGSLELDFSINGKPAEVIYLIGGNGAGKTTILREIQNLSKNIGYSQELSEKKLEYTIELPKKDLAKIFPDMGKLGTVGNQVFKISIDMSKAGWDALSATFMIDKNEYKYHGSVWNHGNKEALEILYFEPNPDSTYRKITNTTSLSLDKNNTKVTTSSSYNEIAQLLVDIQSEDYSEFANWARENPDRPNSEYTTEQRTARFENAFNEIFENKKYFGLRTESGQKKILFKEGDSYFDIGDLSSGEKQIVLRASNILKNIKINFEKIALIDEPEVSLHPELQLKIVNFYKRLFINNIGKFESQFIISTHSPFILDKINHTCEKVIHIERKNGKTTTRPIAEFYGWNDKKIISESFNINIDQLHDEHTVLLEGETDEIYFITAKLLENTDSKFQYKWVGRTVDNGRVEFTGDKALNQTLSFALSHPGLLKGKLVLLYDKDTNKPTSSHPKIQVRTLPEPNKNGTITKGIESILDLSFLDIPFQSFWKEESKTDEYGVTSTINKLDKMKLCKHICGLEDLEKRRAILTKVIKTIKTIEEDSKL